jgi:microcystin-dependent protein
MGGAKTHQLTSAEMPSHTHVQNAHTHTQNAHNHAQDPHTHTQATHNHAQDYHDHGPGSLVAVSTTDDTHVHSGPAAGYMFAFSTSSGGGTGGYQGAPGSGYALQSSTSTGEQYDNLGRPTHTHALSGRVEGSIATNQAFTAVNNNTTATNQAFTAVNNNFTAVNQNTGNDTAHNNLQPYVVFLKLIRAL